MTSQAFGQPTKYKQGKSFGKGQRGIPRKPAMDVGAAWPQGVHIRPFWKRQPLWICFNYYEHTVTAPPAPPAPDHWPPTTHSPCPLFDDYHLTGDQKHFARQHPTGRKVYGAHTQLKETMLCLKDWSRPSYSYLTKLKMCHRSN